MFNNLKYLKDKTVLITGGAKRIGQAMTIACAGAGMNVIIHYHRSEQEAEQLLNQLKEWNTRVYKYQADLSNLADVNVFFSRIKEEIGRVDYLINNASVFKESQLKDISIDELYGTFNINSIAPLLLCRDFIQQTKKGAIVNILDSRITGLDLKHVAYQLSKNMLYTLTKMMALEYAPDVRVNGVAPGIILPPAGKTKSYLNKIVNNNLLKRPGKLEDITDTVLFLLSNQFISGEVIFVDGGQSLKQH